MSVTVDAINSGQQSRDVFFTVVTFCEELDIFVKTRPVNIVGRVDMITKFKFCLHWERLRGLHSRECRVEQTVSWDLSVVMDRINVTSEC